MPKSVEQGPRGGRFYLSSTGQKIYLGQGKEAPEDKEAGAGFRERAAADAARLGGAPRR